MDSNNNPQQGNNSPSLTSTNSVKSFSVARKPTPSDQQSSFSYRPAPPPPSSPFVGDSSLPNIPPSAHLPPRGPSLNITPDSPNSSPISYTSGIITRNEPHPTSPFTSGPKVEESAGLLQPPLLNPHGSIRSMFSRQDQPHPQEEPHEEFNEKQSPIQPVNSIFTQKAIERHLPIVMEEDDDSDDEDLPDIKKVVKDLNKNDSESSDSSRESSPGLEDDDKRKRRGHRSKLKSSKSKSQSKSSKYPSKFVRVMRDFYVSILSKTLITRAFIYWLPLATILFIPLAVGAWANPNASLGNSSLMWLFIWIEVVWGSLWISRIVAHFLPVIFGVFFRIVSPGLRKYTTILAALELAITLVFWAFVSFITFIPLLSLNHKALKDAHLTRPWQRVVNNILVALLISSIIYLAERLFIHLLSVSFHKTRFAARIKSNKQATSTLSLLLQAAYQVFPQFCEEFEHEDLALESGIALRKGKKSKGIQSIAATENMQKVVGTMHRVVGSAANALGNVARDIRGGSKAHQSSAFKTVADSLESKHLAEILAIRIWQSLVLEDSEALTIDDLVEVIGIEYQAEAKALFDTLDKDSNGDLTLQEIITSVKEISKERKTIYRSLRDMDSAIGKLHNVLLFVVAIIIIIVFIGMLAPSVGAVLATLGSTLLALSFVFSATAQELLASCVFLFVKHPLDVGDVVTITLNGTSATMVVLEISLLYTVLKDNSTNVIRQAPNAMLNTLWIDNTTRSGPMATPFTLTLGLPETTEEDLEIFKNRLDEFLEENDRDYFPKPYCQITNYPDLDCISLTISVTYRNNFADGTLLGNRRTKLLKFFATCVSEIPLHIPRRADTFSNPELPMISTSNTHVKKNGLRTRQPFGFSKPVEIGNENVFTDEPLSAKDKAMQDVAMASGFNRSTSTNSRATTTGINRSISRGMRKRV